MGTIVQYSTVWSRDQAGVDITGQLQLRLRYSSSAQILQFGSDTEILRNSKFGSDNLINKSGEHYGPTPSWAYAIHLTIPHTTYHCHQSISSRPNLTPLPTIGIIPPKLTPLPHSASPSLASSRDGV